MSIDKRWGVWYIVVGGNEDMNDALESARMIDTRNAVDHYEDTLRELERLVSNELKRSVEGNIRVGPHIHIDRAMADVKIAWHRYLKVGR